ncbi:MAG: glycosyltransferase, partial [Chloroherpetonaceae bacterium]|nr:glycosyltransferase [Chloroherpetonaceae bacterium]
RKGSDAFIRLAKLMPSTRFVLAGLRGEALKRAKRDAEDATNCEILPGPLSLYDDLIPLYERASAYCQFSLSETFGVAVVEAMLCGALPIVFPNGALPEIVGAAGKIVESIEEASHAISESFSLSISHRESIARYAARFSLDKREMALRQVLSSLRS